MPFRPLRAPLTKSSLVRNCDSSNLGNKASAACRTARHSVPLGGKPQPVGLHSRCGRRDHGRCRRLPARRSPLPKCAPQAFAVSSSIARITDAAIRWRSAATHGRTMFGCPTLSRGLPAGRAARKARTSAPTSVGRRRPDAQRCPDDTTSGQPNRDRGMPV
jgi:hypothetical protein